MFTKKGDHLVR